MWRRDEKILWQERKVEQRRNTKKALLAHKRELKQTHKIWKRNILFLRHYHHSIFNMHDILYAKRSGFERKETRKKLPASIMKSGTCFRLMELIKNVKYVLREVVLKASRWIIHHIGERCKNYSTWHNRKTIDTINLSQQSIWLCNQFFKEKEKRLKENGKSGQRWGEEKWKKKRQIMMKLKWINPFNQSCKVCIKLSFIISITLTRKMSLCWWSRIWTIVKFLNPFAITTSITLSDFHVKKRAACDLKKLRPKGATFFQSNFFFLLSPNT